MTIENDLQRLRDFDWAEVSADPSWRRETLALYYFHTTLMCMTDQNGWTFTGSSFSQRGLNTLLCVKAQREGTPLVAFVTEKLPTGCVVVFCRMWLEDRVKWYPDKYAKT